RETLLIKHIDAEANPRLAKLLPDAKNLVITPLLAEDRPIGVVAAEHSMRHGSRIEQRVVAMVSQFSSHAALALDNAWLLERVQELAETDGLTGIANRRTFESVLELEVTRAFRNGDKVSLVMADIDHFKKLNDTYGHQTGDQVLREVAAALGQGCRDIDIVARYGGEEFAVILPSCGEAEALEIAERLRQVVAGADTAVSVSTSAGVATYPVNAASSAQLVQAADEVLYESKRAGRNRVTMSSRTVLGDGMQTAYESRLPVAGTASP
ncbi:MAG: sensor domain-containing diguanylate cyclase, partial [Actinomycetota bacterium]|nr:sensor domain-containing diguanylate cyclase [Actinomycetota bacterium]